MSQVSVRIRLIELVRVMHLGELEDVAQLRGAPELVGAVGDGTGHRVVGAVED